MARMFGVKYFRPSSLSPEPLSHDPTAPQPQALIAATREARPAMIQIIQRESRF